MKRRKGDVAGGFGRWLNCGKMVEYAAKDECIAADIVAVWLGDVGANTLCGGLLYHRYSMQ